MVTANPLPVPSAAVRGSVQKTFVQSRVLGGFMDPSHFEMIAGDHLATLDAAGRDRALAEVDAARAFVSQLQPFSGSAALGNVIAGPHIDSIRAEPLFAQTFGQMAHEFRYVDPTKLIALQPWIEPRGDAVPTDEPGLLEYALPRTWDVPAELSFVAPMGPIQIPSSNPSMAGISVELDQATGKVSLSPPKHLNLVQVVHLAGRYFLRNGYHRVADALAAGRNEIPALVIQGLTPDHAALPGQGMFGIGYVFGLARPPLLSDFQSGAAVTTQVRERRYGVLVSLDVKPVNIGI